MPHARTSTVLLALLLGLAACGGPEEVDPAPIGSGVGAAGSDAAAGPVAGDSAATAGAHP